MAKNEKQTQAIKLCVVGLFVFFYYYFKYLIYSL